jgi:putative transposase
MAVEQVLTAPRSPWRNPHAEGLVGSVRREYLDRVIDLGEHRLDKILRSYIAYYHKS